MRSFLLLLLLACPSWAAPPSIEIPAEVRPAGGYVRIKPKTDAVSVVYVGLSGVDAFPSDLLKDPRDFVLPVGGLKDGIYKFSAVGASATGEQTRVDFSVPIGTNPGPITPPPVDPPTKPDDPPPPTKPAALYFLIVRSDAPAAPAFTKTMSLPAWDELRAAGHTVKDKTLTEAAKLGWSPPDGTPLPALVTLQNSADGKTSVKVRNFIELPTTNDTIRALPTISKGN